MKILLSLLSLFVLAACGGKDKTAALSDRIRQTWTVNVARENSTVVYTKGAASNTKPAYATFKLDLSNTQTQRVVLTEIDGNSFTGTWTLSADEKKLTLGGLTPQPTGTNGILEFTLNGEPSDISLNLTRTTANLKTGGTINGYELVK